MVISKLAETDLDPQITELFPWLRGHLGVDLEVDFLYLKGFHFVETPKLVNDTFCPLLSLSLSLFLRMLT
jgi:hypothetical protein